MEVVMNTRTRLVHIIEDGAEIQDGRMQLLCGANAEPQNLSYCSEPRDEGKACQACSILLKTTSARWRSMTAVAKKARV